MPRKTRPFAAILNLVDALTEDQRADLLDYLKGKQPKRERKPGKKTEKPAKIDRCVVCGNEKDFADHQESSTNYHLFRTSLKSK